MKCRRKNYEYVEKNMLTTNEICDTVMIVSKVIR